MIARFANNTRFRADFIKELGQLANRSLRRRLGLPHSYKITSTGKLTCGSLKEVEKEKPKLKNVLTLHCAQRQIDPAICWFPQLIPPFPFI